MYGVAAGDGSKPYYFIVSKLNGLVLDIKRENKKPGATLIMYRKNGKDHQLWYDDRGRIRSKLNGFCLSIEGITAAEPYSVEQQPNTVKNTNTVRTQNAMNSETWREI